jgi:hypothetical protein
MKKFQEIYSPLSCMEVRGIILLRLHFALYHFNGGTFDVFGLDCS